jgi:hypothetical protein
MPNALTLETMSPGLLKVGETRSPEPHRRKSRMRNVAIRVMWRVCRRDA